MEKDEKREEIEAMIVIDPKLGLSYCMDSEEIYKEILEEFIEQVKIYLPQLDKHFEEQNWEQYAIITHSLKSNSLNIGASAFSKVCLQHELAGKEKDESFILAQYKDFIVTLNRLTDEVRKIR